MSSFSLTTSPHSPRQGRSDPGRIAPFLTNVVAHHGQLTLVPPQNMGRIRRGEKKTLERARTERRRDAEEPRFNTAAPASPRSASRRVHNPERNPRPTPAAPSRFSRDTMIPDYPPPSFQEAMMTPPFIPPPPPAETQELVAPVPSDEDRSSVQEPLPAIEVLPSTTSSPSVSPSTDIANPPPAPPQPLTLRMEITPDADHESPQSHGSSASSGSDNGSEDSSIELINLDTDGYDQEQRLRGPLRCRANRIHRRQHCKEPHGIHTPRQVSHLSIDVDDLHDRCTRCGSHRPSDCDGPESPTDHSHTSSSMSSHSPPGSPKASKWRRLFVPAGGHNVEPLPMSPTVSSPRSPRFGFLPSALASTLTLSAPSQPSPSKPFTNPVQHSQRKEPSVMRRIFSPKGKERDGHGTPELRNPRDSVDWEFIDNKELSSLEEDEGEDEIRQQHESLPAQRGVTKASTNTPRSQSTATITQGGRSEETPSPTQARRNTIDHRAFLNRPVRHSPLSLNPFPMFSANSSVVSLPLVTTAHERLQPMHVSPNSTNNTEDPGQMGSPSLARRQTLSVSHASPSVVWLPLITGDDGTVTVAGSPVVSAIPSSLSGLSSRTPSRLGQEAANLQSGNPPNPSPVSYSSGRPSHLLPSPLAFSFTPDHEAEEPSPSPTFTDSPGQDSPQEASELRSIPPLRSPASASTLGSTNSNDPPSSPTTPTRHYSGRPLPQLPGPPHPFEGSGRTPLFRPAFLPGQVVSGPYPQVSDLDVFAARVIEDDTDGRHYEDLLRIAELAGPAVSPDKNGDDGLTLPPSGRVKLKRRRVTKDGRVKLKLTLMDAVVDKCGICLSQFKEAEVACLGTACPHAFHEYCLKRWIATRRNCPLCRADI